MAQGKGYNDENTEDWRENSLLFVLMEWSAKNASLPNDMVALIGYVLFFLTMWFLILWAARFLLSLVWPIVIVVSAVVLFRFLNAFEASELVDFLFQAVTLLADILVLTMSKTIEFLLNCI